VSRELGAIQFFENSLMIINVYIQFHRLLIMKMAIAGFGYVGLSNAVLLA
jgi:hypothetical protein